MRDYKAIYEEWLTNPYFDEETRQELKAIADDDKEIMERFHMDLEFGTAGLRGVIGAGTNRMNKYVVRRATQGLANYIIEQGGQSKGVAIAYDSRHMSIEFSDEVARTLAANGIKAYRFESLRPTPELSYAVRYLGCIAGINITASHNPSSYNGYKVYWEDGAQFTPPHDKAVTERVLAITDMSACKTMSKEDAEAAGLYITIGKDVDDPYIAEVKKTILHPEVIREMAESISIVYTPLHGTGHVPAMRMMHELGFTHVYEVPEQAEPDGDFPTVSYPNPESPAAFELGLKLAKEKNADLVLATDPDADRLGVYVRDDKSGSYIPLTGNMSGSLLCEYELSERKAMGTLPKDAFVVESIVSTDMIKAIAAGWGVEAKEVLTGFKWIGREILKAEGEGVGQYVFGMEESYGCLIGTYARDKDAISAVTSLCEAAAFYKKQGKTLWDVMTDMYKKYGYYKENVKTIELKGIEGLKMIGKIMDTLRADAPKSFGSYRVERFRDYSNDIITDLREGHEGETCPTGLAKSNVLYFELNDNAWVCVRPSGTEPKLKFYTGVKGKDAADAEALNKALLEDISGKIDKIMG